MSEQQHHVEENELTEFSSIGRRTDRPAVGIVATPDNADFVASTILRGQKEGYDVLVCHGGDATLESVSFAEQLGAPVVEVERAQVDGPGFTETLSRSARDFGYPGVLLHVEGENHIDFDSSADTLQKSSDYLADAVLVPSVRADALVLVAIPAYNEESSIADVVRRSRPHADEVVVVDDGSTDDTVRLAEEAGATVIIHEENKGYGGALKTAFTEATRCHAEHLVILDGDGQHDPSDITKLVDAQKESGAEIVIGSRSVDDSETDMPLYRRFGFGVVNVLTNLSMGVIRAQSRVADTQSGFRVYDSMAISTLANHNIGDNMSASTDILHHAHKHGYSVQEVGTSITYDVDDTSSHHPVRHGLQLIGNLVRTIERERPLMLLGVPGFVSIVLSVILVYFILSAYINTGAFPIGLAIIAGLFGLLGAFTSFTGIILHSLQTHLN